MQFTSCIEHSYKLFYPKNVCLFNDLWCSYPVLKRGWIFGTPFYLRRSISSLVK